MDKNDLKSMWHDAHYANQDIIYDKVSIEKSITMNHCKAISKTLLDIKLRILVFALVLVVYIGLMLYALVYLDLNLSVYSLFPLTLTGLFLLIKITSEINRLFVLTRTADNMSVKESLLFFCKKLDRIKLVDFISYVIFLYLLAILLLFNYIKEIGGFKKLSWSNDIFPLPLLGILILILLLIPWFIKYQHNQRYKRLYLNLKDSGSLLNDVS